MEGRQRWDRFADRTAESRRAAGSRPAFEARYWRAFQDLFTRDVRGRDLVEFLQREPRETLRFLADNVDLSGLSSRPWPIRGALTLWRVFLATAHRLSPPRRILFAIAVPILLIGWVRLLFLQDKVWGWTAAPFSAWLLISATLLLFLLVTELKDKLSLKGDLEIARQIQFGLLPFEPFDHEGLRVRVTMRPANTVGGDYFDIIDLGNGQVGVAMGDVAGKGMPAALLMALLQGSLQTLITAGLRGPALMAKLNEHLCAQIPSNRLITLFFAEVDAGHGCLRYVNAGHNPPLLFRAEGAVERLAATGMALGILPAAAFEETQAFLGPADRLILYTDGITEAADTNDREYGEERLVGFLAARRSADPKTLLDDLVTDVVRSCGLARPGDDMTAMCVDRTAPRS
jgi:sigma-B regulation protein RsbU (phosphoserine phosphatase)